MPPVDSSPLSSKPRVAGSSPAGRASLFDSFSESTDWASVPVRHRPPQTVSFRVANRVAGVFAWQNAWQDAFKDSKVRRPPRVMLLQLEEEHPERYGRDL